MDTAASNRPQLVLFVTLIVSICGAPQLFFEPVDTERFHDYTAMVENPQDLGTIQTSLLGGHYTSRRAFVEDVLLVFANCMVYNNDHSVSFDIRSKAR